MKRKLDDSMITEALEVLAAQFPWDTVDIWVRRQPEGRVEFTAYVSENKQFGTTSVFGNGKSPMAATRDAIKSGGIREPEAMRQQKIRELRTQIERLQSVVIGLPPYRPGTYLTNGAADEAPIEVNSNEQAL